MKIFSFNSYKGGACRTTTCYNTLPFLAKALGATPEEPLIVYDIDLDSMGLTSIFNNGINVGREKMKYSATNLFVDDEYNINRDRLDELGDSVLDSPEYFSYYKKVGKELGLEEEGSVLFLGADLNASTVTDDSYRSFSQEPPIYNIISRIKEMEITPKAIVFDCASGVQMTTLVALQHADCCVMCMRPTYQFRVGTSEYLIRKIPDEIGKRKTRKSREIILLPTSVAQVNVPDGQPERETEFRMLSNMRNRAMTLIRRDIINECTKESKIRDLGYTLNTEMVEDRENSVVGIPEIERFKWEEGLLYNLDDITEQEAKAKSRYDKLAQIMAR
ncbi:MAG: hypothetical protein K2M64_01435 [Clostridia bacterium]|nr:hypothetical protein [Clostridia bacterium]